MCLRFDLRVESSVVVVVKEEGRNRRQFQQWGLNTETRPKRQSESLGSGALKFARSALHVIKNTGVKWSINTIRSRSWTYEDAQVQSPMYEAIWRQPY